jgi:hypothetical protein
MSQSDYLKMKRTGVQLRNLQKDNGTVLEPGRYTDFKDYNIETTVANTKSTFNLLRQTSKQIVFGMERDVSNCPTFALCNRTDLRPNRTPNDAMQMTCFPIMKAPGMTVPKLYKDSKKPHTNNGRPPLVRSCKCKTKRCECSVDCSPAPGCVANHL